MQNQPPQTSRNALLDIVKGLGIVAVFVGHSVFYSSTPFRMVFFFHMPLFFLVSGLLFKPEKYVNYGAVVRNVLIKFAVPYLLFVLIGALCQFDLCAARWTSSVVREVYRTFIQGYGCFGLWFLTCLGVVHFLAYAIWRTRVLDFRWGKVAALALLCLLSSLVSFFISRHNILCHAPLTFASVPAALFFYLLGFSGHMVTDKIKKPLTRPILVVVGTFAFAGLYAYAKYSSVVPFNISHGRFPLAALAPCSLGVIACFALGLLIDRSATFLREGVSYIGRHSLIFFGMEQNISCVMTLLAKKVGIALPEVYYLEETSVLAVLARISVCMTCSALVAVPLMKYVRVVQSLVAKGM